MKYARCSVFLAPLGGAAAPHQGCVAQLRTLLLAVSAFLLLAPHAWAGHWELVRYKCSGTCTWSPFTAPDTGSYTWPAEWMPGQAPYFMTGAWADTHEWANSLSCGANGTISAVFKWTRNQDGYPDTSTPPAQVWVRASAYASASVSQGQNATASTSLPGEPQISDGAFGGRSVWVEGRALYPLPVDTSLAEPEIETAAITFNTSASQNVVRTDDVARTIVSAGFAILSAPMITSDTIETSYHSENGVPVANVREPGGGITTDSAAWHSYADSEYYPDGRWVGSADLYAWQEIFSDPWFTWNTSGDGLIMSYPNYQGEHGAYNRINLELGTELPAQAMGKSTSLLVAVAQRDDPASPQIAARFTIRWHYPYENWRQYADSWDVPFDVDVGTDPPGVAYAGGAVECHWTYNNVYFAAFETVRDPAANLLDATPIWELAALFKLVNALWPHAETQSGIATFDGAWGATESTFFPDQNGARDKYTMTPFLVLGYTIYPYEGDTYDAHGFTGITKRPVAPFNGSRHWAGHFTRDDGGSGGYTPPYESPYPYPAP